MTMTPELEEAIVNPKLEDMIKHPRPTNLQIDPNKTLIAMPARLQIAIVAMSGHLAHHQVGLYSPTEVAQWSLMQADALIEQYNTGNKFTMEDLGYATQQAENETK